MIFKNLIRNWDSPFDTPKQTHDVAYAVTEDNFIEAFRILYENSLSQGRESNSNIEIATVSPSAIAAIKFFTPSVILFLLL